MKQSLGSSNIHRNVGNINLGPPSVQKHLKLKLLQCKKYFSKNETKYSNDSTSTEDSFK